MAKWVGVGGRFGFDVLGQRRKDILAGNGIKVLARYILKTGKCLQLEVLEIGKLGEEGEMVVMEDVVEGEMSQVFEFGDGFPKAEWRVVNLVKIKFRGASGKLE